jgi:PAS domain S-box-containing protein
MADRQGTIIRANQQAEKIFGYAQHELLGQPIENLVPEKLHDLHRIYRSGYYAAPSTRSMDEGLELRSKRKDGSEFPVEIALSPVRSGGEIQVLAVVRDITERKLGEDALRESEGNFVMLANCVPQMVWMCSPDGLNVYFNQRWVEYTGLTLEESYGRGWNTPWNLPGGEPAASRRRKLSLVSHEGRTLARRCGQRRQVVWDLYRYRRSEAGRTETAGERGPDATAD